MSFTGFYWVSARLESTKSPKNDLLLFFYRLPGFFFYRVSVRTFPLTVTNEFYRVLLGFGESAKSPTNETCFFFGLPSFYWVSGHLRKLSSISFGATWFRLDLVCCCSNGFVMVYRVFTGFRAALKVMVARYRVLLHFPRFDEARYWNSLQFGKFDSIDWNLMANLGFTEFLLGFGRPVMRRFRFGSTAESIGFVGVGLFFFFSFRSFSFFFFFGVEWAGLGRRLGGAWRSTKDNSSDGTRQQRRLPKTTPRRGVDSVDRSTPPTPTPPPPPASISTIPPTSPTARERERERWRTVSFPVVMTYGKVDAKLGKTQ